MKDHAQSRNYILYVCAYSIGLIISIFAYFSDNEVDNYLNLIITREFLLTDIIIIIIKSFETFQNFLRKHQMGVR